MFADIFIHFILNNGLISKKQACDVLTKRVSKVRPAIKAVYVNLITEDEAISIMNLQKSEDMPFEYLASRENLLSNEQLLPLLSEPAREDMLVMQVLYDKGILQMSEFMQNIDAFKAHYCLTDKMYDELVINDAGAYVKYIAEISDENSYFSIFSVVFINTFMKNVTPSFRVEKAYKKDIVNEKYVFYVECYGDDDIIFGIAVNDTESLLNYASRFSRQRIREYNEDADDCIKELLNLAAGIFIEKIEKKLNLNLDIRSPKSDTVLESPLPINAINAFSCDGNFTIFMTDSAR